MFAGETDCTYYFDWETAFACVKEKEDLLCRVRDGNKHYDLSPLTRIPGEFARAPTLIGRFLINTGNMVEVIYISVQVCINADLQFYTSCLPLMKSRSHPVF